jgi:uncharacterized membrane protein
MESVSGHLVEMIHVVVDWAALGIELVAVAIIVGAVVMLAVRRGIIRFLIHMPEPGAFNRYRLQLGKALLLGLELMVAADVVRTVTIEPTLTNATVLGVLVLVRTFLSWGMSVEIEGCWPWQGRARSAAKTAPDKTDKPPINE